ncbi:50S ribosomal protein L4 [Candidatus Bathyarchaeota archaeon]|nr:50S ribosomal protein L4 [Candidatus Bathyarchaeota archaeon]
MMVPVLNMNGEQVEEMELPRIFQTPIRPDVIWRAVIALQSHRFQPQGRDPLAGKRTTAESWGVNRGLSRVPRLRDSRRAAFGVGTVGGHQAFPPTSIKRIRKEINKKERRLAIRSAIAATAVRDLVAKRGHDIHAVASLPIVVEDKVESLNKAREARDLLTRLGVWPDVERSDRKKIRAGRGKMRGRKKKLGRGPLIVISEDRGISKAFSNIPGVEVVKVSDLNAELLAPGARPGRLVIWTKNAFATLDEIWGEKN